MVDHTNGQRAMVAEDRLPERTQLENPPASVGEPPVEGPSADDDSADAPGLLPSQATHNPAQTMDDDMLSTPPWIHPNDPCDPNGQNDEMGPPPSGHVSFLGLRH